jgi:hypothetical protein
VLPHCRNDLAVHRRQPAILVNSPPQVILLAVYFYEDFIDVKCIAVTPVLALKASGINGPELDTPKADRFPGDGDAAFGQEIFNISMTYVESEVEPDSIGNNIGRESVSFVGIHEPILAISAH